MLGFLILLFLLLVLLLFLLLGIYGLSYFLALLLNFLCVLGCFRLYRLRLRLCRLRLFFLGHTKGRR